MAGCKVHVQNEIKEKADRGEELSDEEQSILNADSEELDQLVPSAYGPLSGANIAHCPFCHRVGQVGAFTIGAIIGSVLYLQAGGIKIEPTVGFGIGLAVWLVLAAVVGYKGYFPVLGPLIGPRVERLLAGIGKYPTATARREYRDSEAATDGGTAVENGANVIVGEDAQEVHLPDDYFEVQEDRAREKFRHLKRKLEAAQESLSEERAEKFELKEELENNRQELKKTKQVEQQAQQQLQDHEEELQTANQKVQQLSDFGHNRDAQNRLPIMVWDNGVPVGPKWFVKIVQVKLDIEGYHGTYKFAFVVNDQAAELPDHIPSTIQESELGRYEDHLLPHPEKVRNPPEYEHMGEPGYPHVDRTDAPVEEYPRVLFWEDLGEVRDARQRIDETTKENEIQHAFLTLAYDTRGRYVPPPFDARGFEPRSELRDKARKRFQQIRELNMFLESKDNVIDDLQHQLTVLEERFKMQEGRIRDSQEQAKSLSEAAFKMTRQSEQDRKKIEHLNNEAETSKLIADRATEQVRNERKKRMDDAAEDSRLLSNYNAAHNREQVMSRVFNAIWGSGWNHPTDPYDYEAIKEGKSDTPIAEVVREFRAEADPDEYDRLLKRIDNELHSVMDGDSS